MIFRQGFSSSRKALVLTYKVKRVRSHRGSDPSSYFFPNTLPCSTKCSTNLSFVERFVEHRSCSAYCSANHLFVERFAEQFASIKKTPGMIIGGLSSSSDLTNYKLKNLKRNSSIIFTQTTGGFNRPCCLSCMFVLHRSVLLCSFYGFILEKKSVLTMAHLLTI